MGNLVAKSFLAFFLAMACVAMMAGTPSHAADGWYDGLRVVHGGYYLVETDSPLADCEAPGRFAIRGDAVMAKEMYATAVMAFLTGKRINIYVDAAQGCLNNGMVATLISIHD